MHSVSGSTYRDGVGHHRGDLPVSGVRAPAGGIGAGPVEPLRAQASRQRERDDQGSGGARQGEYVSGEFFRGLAVSPAAGRLILADDDRAGAAPVAVMSHGLQPAAFRRRRRAPTGQPILINNVPFTVVGVTPSGVLRRRSRRAAPHVYLPHARRASSSTRTPAAHVPRPELLLGRDDGTAASRRRAARRRRPRSRGPFAQWVAHDRDQRSRARQSSGAAPRGRGGRARQPQAPVLAAALRAAGDGRPDPGHRLREHGEPAARAGRAPAGARWRCGSASAPAACASCASC